MIELKKERFRGLMPALKAAEINTMFAMSVLDGKADGKVFADDEDAPSSFYIRHFYGMALLCGEQGKEKFYEELKPYLLNSGKTRKTMEWLQVYPAALYPRMDAILGNCLKKKGEEEPYNGPSAEEEDKVLEYQRINFTLKKEKYLAFKKSLPIEDIEIVKTTEEVFNRPGGSVVPKWFWDSFSDFEKYGIGFTVMKDGIPASTAFSSAVIDRRLEIGIETDADYRGSGLASRVCSRLIEHCLDNGFEPVWACNSGNIGSRKLAEKLGFEERRRIPYYRLPFQSDDL